MFVRKKQYSYIKKPFAKNGWMSLVLTSIAFLLTQGLLFVSIKRGGDAGIVMAVLSVWAILLDIAGVAFGVAGMAEKEKNYTIVIICFVLEIVVLLEWVIVLRTG